MASAIEQAKSVAIRDVISRYVSGVQFPYHNNANMSCPFHKDAAPSFHIYPHTNTFHCFSCGAGGTVIDFVMHATGLIDPLAAAKTICDDFGLEYEQVPVDEKYALYYDVYKYTESLFMKANTRYVLPDGTVPMAYWKKRKVDGLVNSYGLGFCPPAFLDSSRRVVPFAKILKAKFPGCDPYEYGLTDKAGNCLFSDRYMFPIRDARGKTIAFSGRARDNSSPAKYKNSPETEHFHKRSLLYNLDVARGYGSVIIVEGHVDALSLIVSGVPNVVAAMGTAITPEHLTHLQNKRILLAFDNDNAGMKKQAGLVSENINKIKFDCLKVGTLGKYKDFNEALVAGKDCAELVNKIHWCFGLEYLLQWYKVTSDLSNVYDRDNLYENMCKYINNCCYGDVVQNYVYKHTLRLLGIKF